MNLWRYYFRLKGGFSLLMLAGLVVGCQAPEISEEPSVTRPNILLIVADDLGMNDIGVFGSEISTPNIDKLAATGATFTYFHTAPSCSPSRAMLLTGIDNHKNGLGSMAHAMAPNMRRQDGYEGHLRTDALTIAERLRDVGYVSFMSGKWHLGHAEEHGPHNRGFDRSFALLDGGANHFNNLGHAMHVPEASYREDGKITRVPGDTFSSDNYANKLIEYLGSASDDQPFFAYLAFTAPHWPIQAPDAYIQKYQDAYQLGWDALYDERLAGYKASGLSNAQLEHLSRYDDVPAWGDLTDEQQALEAKKMAVYAAMVDNMDHNIGRVISYLEDAGKLDNTLIIFLSDNGPDVHDFRFWPPFHDYLVSQGFDNSIENLGRHNSYFAYGPGWGRLSNVAGKHHKYVVSQGGVNAPLIMTFPSRIRPQITDALFSIKDIAPTVFDLANVDIDVDDERGAMTVQGRSALPLLSGETKLVYAEDEVVGIELFGHSALYMGDLKLSQVRPPFGDGEWHLYNLRLDPHEAIDISAIEPEMFEQMKVAMSTYRRDNGVIDPPEEWVLFDRAKYFPEQ